MLNNKCLNLTTLSIEEVRMLFLNALDYIAIKDQMGRKNLVHTSPGTVISTEKVARSTKDLSIKQMERNNKCSFTQRSLFLFYEHELFLNF